MSFTSTAYQLAFQLSPVFLSGGIAGALPGGGLPLILLTEALDFAGGVVRGATSALSGGLTKSLDSYWAQWEPLPGATLISNQLGTFPFANQTVAANAIIRQPLVISMLMRSRATDTMPFPARLATVMGLKAALDRHNAQGGTYTVLTPSFIYTNCILVEMTDASGDGGRQKQTAWRFDFVKPLLTLEDAQSVQGALMSKLSSGGELQGQPAWSGTTPSIGAENTASAPGAIPSAGGTPAPISPPLSSPPVSVAPPAPSILTGPPASSLPLGSARSESLFL